MDGVRLSTNTLFARSSSRLTALQSSQFDLQNKISTGKRVNKPSDDPVATSKIMTLTQQKNEAAQFNANRSLADTQLSAADSTLDSVSDLLLNIKSSIISAGNGALNNSDRAVIANQLTQSLDQLAGLANTTDYSGNFIFSGYAVDTKPFNNPGTGYVYQGDTVNAPTIQISATRQMQVTDNGANIFQKGGNDVFAIIQNAITLLNTPVVTPADQAALTAGIDIANGGLKTGLDNILTARSAFGSRLNEIEALNDDFSTKNIVFQSSISDLEDLDFNAAISTITKQQTILEAAQKSFVKITSNNLFDLI